jgi:hypothetical protein
MESWTHEGVRDEDRDWIEAVVEEGVDAKDNLVEDAICEAPHRSCQVQEQVGKQGTMWCC